MKIVGFAGSTSSTSINATIVDYVLGKFATEHSVEKISIRDYEAPIYCIDHEKENGIPTVITEFIEKIQQADALVISLAEHNSGITAAFKNLLDWCSRAQIDFFQEKPVLLLSTSPGGFGGGNAMAYGKLIFPKFKAQLIETFSIPKYHENFKDGKFVNPEIEQDLVSKINLFDKHIRIRH